MEENMIKELIRQALEAREKAYTPYSGFQVGAAILTDDGHIFAGCNIENAAYSPGICAERTAAVKAVSAGERHFAAVCVVGAREGAGPDDWQFCYPCGVCRQFLMEFSSPGTAVIIARSETDYRLTTMGELLPESFGPRNLE